MMSEEIFLLSESPLKITPFELVICECRFRRGAKNDPFFPDIVKLMAELLENISPR